ncbi:hypothetical protein SARC_13541 [Sphaeroforma arctica JP610]|uniref:Uncharacterized protein n=1 Tax=Sphaeroforma arctica JP610 TaxID=667725 RepID=A0A0L0FCU1_9EUKA|nr:hypothetical protein SARC_13541 [Sphaeroforma arctica JP610]KNC73898.1 hypothetical protein SARC_13541 [Sphaeroforma arctica JP610]|eukprot:XP_014147800.1 hypothetical protein SARC_13541 [Sphaeroforma arctica JP610]
MLDIPPPVQISHLDDDISESSAALVAVAINPHLNIPASDVDSGIDVVTVVKIGLVCSAIAAVGFVLMRTAMR